MTISDYATVNEIQTNMGIIMSLSCLSSHERLIVLECLEAALNGPFFPESEFSIIFGLNRSELSDVVNNWHQLDEDDKIAMKAINGAFNNLLGYPHKCNDIWSDFISVSRNELENIYSKWKNA